MIIPGCFLCKNLQTDTEEMVRKNRLLIINNWKNKCC